MPCRNCRQKAQAKFYAGVKIKRLVNEPNTDPAPEDEFVVEFLGAGTNEVKYRGPTGKAYRFAAGSSAVQKICETDALFFNQLSMFRVHAA